MFSFISTPASNLYVTLEKINELYKSSFIMTTVFWLGVVLTIKHWGVNSFAIFKFIAGFIVMLYYLNHIIKFLKMSFKTFFKQTIFRMVLPLIIQVAFLAAIKNLLPAQESSINLISVIIAGGISTSIGLLTLYLTSNDYYQIINIYISKLLKNKLK